MGIDRPLEKEQAMCTGVERNENVHKHALARGKDSTARAKGDASRYICEIRPVQIALVARRRNDSRQANIDCGSFAVKMPHKTHRSRLQVEYSRCGLRRRCGLGRGCGLRRRAGRGGRCG